MKTRLATTLLAILVVSGCAASDSDPPIHDPTLLEGILEDFRVGWEQGDGTPFYTHFLDWDGARYFEGGGQNVGLRDLVENHVEPEAELGLRLEFSNLQSHFEGSFAWAVVDTDIQLTTPDGRDIHNRGHGTYLFRWVDGAWKVVHTQSGSSPVQDAESDEVAGQDSKATQVIDLNRRIMHQQIIARDAGLFDEASLDEFLVVAPGGRIENKAEAMGGVDVWDAQSIEVRDEQVIFHGNTAVLVGRLQIDGVMRAVGTLPPMKFMAVFVETEDGWKLLARSLTPCIERAIEHGFC